jgi:hypothetical protein
MFRVHVTDAKRSNHIAEQRQDAIIGMWSSHSSRDGFRVVGNRDRTRFDSACGWSDARWNVVDEEAILALVLGRDRSIAALG